MNYDTLLDKLTPAERSDFARTGQQQPFSVTIGGSLVRGQLGRANRARAVVFWLGGHGEYWGNSEDGFAA